MGAMCENAMGVRPQAAGPQRGRPSLGGHPGLTWSSWSKCCGQSPSHTAEVCACARISAHTCVRLRVCVVCVHTCVVLVLQPVSGSNVKKTR